MLSKLSYIGLLLLLCLSYKATAQDDGCDVYPNSYDHALCKAVAVIHSHLPNCFHFPLETIYKNYHLLRQQTGSPAPVINLLRATGFISQACLSDDQIVDLDDIFFINFRVTTYVSDYFKESVMRSFRGTPIPTGIDVLVPGSDPFFEVAVVFRLFDPSKVLTIDPDTIHHDISQEIYQFHAANGVINPDKIQHADANLGIVCEPRYCDKPHTFLKKNFYWHLALFIHPGPMFIEDVLSSVWNEVITHTLDHVLEHGTALFSLRTSAEFIAVRKLLASRGDFKERRSFCQEGLLMKPFRLPDDRIYRCFLNAEKAGRSRHEEF